MAFGLLLMPVWSARAASEVGSPCTPVGGSAGTYVSAASDPSTTSYSVPADGVITKWGAISAAAGPNPVQLLTFEPLGSDNWLITAEGPVTNLVVGTNQFGSRIPVVDGDRIGGASPNQVPLCASAGPVDLVRYNTSPTTTSEDETVNLPLGLNLRPAFFATFEPDADNDGFGDETQDLCPESVVAQASCPGVKISRHLIIHRHSIEFILTSDIATTVTTHARVRLPAFRKARASTLRFSAAPRNVSPGQLVRIKLKFPAKLQKSLARMHRRQRLKLTVIFTGLGLLDPSKHPVNVMLRGTRR